MDGNTGADQETNVRYSSICIWDFRNRTVHGGAAGGASRITVGRNVADEPVRIAQAARVPDRYCHCAPRAERVPAFQRHRLVQQVLHHIPWYYQNLPILRHAYQVQMRLRISMGNCAGSGTGRGPQGQHGRAPDGNGQKAMMISAAVKVIPLMHAPDRRCTACSGKSQEWK